MPKVAKSCQGCQNLPKFAKMCQMLLKGMPKVAKICTNSPKVCSKMVKSRQRDAKKHKGLLRKELLIGSTEKICLHLKRKLLDFWDINTGFERSKWIGM